jgi:hypothetical protein
MAHANIFQRVNKQAPKAVSREASFDDTTVEAIKILGEQVISLREIIEEQHLVIQDLASTVSNLKVAQKETNQNINLAYIDQKDLAKQLRILKSNSQANQFVQKKERVQVAQKQHDDQEIEELFYHKAKSSTVMKNSAANDAIKKTLEELKKLEKPKQRFLARKNADEQQAPQTRAYNPTSAQQQTKKRFVNEELAKKMIFGRTSKLIK